MKKKREPLNYFFYEGKLHKKIHIERGRDLITAFKYSEGESRKYIYSDVLKDGKKAFTTTEVGKFLNRSPQQIGAVISAGHIHEPEMTYGIDENRNPYKHMWAEQDVYELHEYFLGVHIGRPRKDGLITNGRGLPTKRELRAMMRTGMVLGYQDEAGNFIPTWEAESL